MFRKELQSNMQLGRIEDTEEKETPEGEQLNSPKHICYTCLIGSVLGISVLAICYLVLLTAYAYAIP
jgi:hypothetical protein